MTASARETDLFDQWPEDIPAGVRDDWKDPELDQVLTAELEEALAALTAAAEAGAPAEEAIVLYERAQELLYSLNTNCSFANWSYSRQPQGYGANYDRWSTALSRASNSFTAVEQSLFSGAYEQAFREKLGNLYVDAVLAQPIWGEEQFALQAEEQALIRAYDLRSSQIDTELTYDYGGVTYTIESVGEAFDREELTEDEYYAIYGALGQMANAEIGPIYLELVDVRNRFARSLGYDNYAEYAFVNVYSRDYSAEEGIAYCQSVIEQIAPLASRLSAVDDPDIDIDAGAGSVSGLTDEEMILKVQPYLEDISSEMAGLFQYMLDNDLIDLEALDSKLFAAYTEDLPAYGSAYMFFSPAYLGDAGTLVHEFGHYANFCLASDTVPCFDTLEVHSQGLEMLYLSFADSLAGEDSAASLRSYWLGTMLDSGVVNSAVVAAFELEAYTRGDMDLDALNRSYGRLNEAAGFETIFDGISYGWYQIPHLFNSPCYYISYSTSAASALDILLRSEEDFDRAADQYLALVAQTDVFGYADAMEAAGLTNMMEPGALAALAERLEGYIARNVWEVGPFSDLPESHWAYSDALAAAAGELLLPAGDGSFAPDRTLTGAELDAAMERSMGTPARDQGAEDTVTREELILTVYRCAQGELDTSARADLSGYTDADRIGSEARDAMSWAVATGILTGTSAGTLSPDAPATRAQTAAVLMRLAAVS